MDALSASRHVFSLVHASRAVAEAAQTVTSFIFIVIPILLYIVLKLKTWHIWYVEVVRIDRQTGRMHQRIVPVSVYCREVRTCLSSSFTSFSC
jgi:hypothetical protein